MKKILPMILESGRETTGPFASDFTYRAYGKFTVQGPCGEKLIIVASGADDDDNISEGWEHVSVSTHRRIPNWIEMCFVKDLFWTEDECAVQFHPSKSDYVNNHPRCLHLWRQKAGFPMPPSILVGDKSKGVLTAAEAEELCRQHFGAS